MQLRPVALLFGDSITQYAFGHGGVRSGWASRLASWYQRRADVVNRGFSGYNTRHALELLPRVFSSSDDELLFVTLLLGSNDCALPGQRQHVPIDEYRENLGNIIRGIRERTHCPILVLTPPPIDETALRECFDEDKPSRTNAVAREYGLAAKRVAEDLGCPVLDVWECFGGDQPPGFGHLLSDGLHLSDEGNERLFEGLAALIRDKHPDLSPEGLPLDEKPWDELC